MNNKKITKEERSKRFVMIPEDFRIVKKEGIKKDKEIKKSINFIKLTTIIQNYE